MIMNYLYICSGFGFLYLLAAVASYKIIPEFQSHPNWKLLDRGEDCGHSSGDRIIGGVKASLGQYPWIARMGYRYYLDPSSPDKNIFYDCGGTVISDRYILSAAHCGPDAAPFPLVQVRLGEYHENTNPDCLDGVCAPPVQDIDIEETICHRDYTTSNFQNDICLIRLATPIQFSRFVYPICLPTSEFFQSNQFNNKIMEVAGWGVTNIETGAVSDTLLTLKVPVVDHSFCVSEYNKSVLITDKQMCAGGVIGKDSCSGDSGGPLMSSFSQDAPPRFFLMGIVSFGPVSCASKATPGVYTNVFQYMKWILDNVRK